MERLETERLVLRQMTPDHVDHLLGILSDPVAMRHYPATKDRRETEDWVATNLRRYAEVGVGLWIVELKGSGQFIGTCGLTMQEVDGVREPGRATPSCAPTGGGATRPRRRRPAWTTASSA